MAIACTAPTSRTRGLRFNPNNLLLDPYAKAIDGHESWDKGLFAYEVGDPDGDLKMTANDARGVPLGAVVDPAFDWGDDAPPATPFHKSIIYEAHVRGATMRHPEVPEDAARQVRRPRQRADDPALSASSA